MYVALYPVLLANGEAGMARIFITGSADGLGLAAASTLLAQGHQVIVHARNEQRLAAVQELLKQGASAVVGDLSNQQQTTALAEKINHLGQMDAIIHNAGVYTGKQVLPVNVVAPYLLTARISKPRRLIYLSSGMHLDGRPQLKKLDWTGKTPSGSYSDSKLFVTAFAAAIARLWPDVISSSVNPGWVPTKMGGPNAPDDLRLGHLTQEWLAVSDDADVKRSGGYWYHQHRDEAHAASQDVVFQTALLNDLERATGVSLPTS